MRKLIVIFSAAVTIVFLSAGCASTRSTVTEDDAAGNVVKRSETTASEIS